MSLLPVSGIIGNNLGSVPVDIAYGNVGLGFNMPVDIKRKNGSLKKTLNL